MTDPAPESPLLEWGFAGAGLNGDESGDLHVVVVWPHGALIAVIDGLGHGPEAALASRAAASILEERAREPLQALVERCHEGLRKTRGVVMSLASLDSRSATIDWCGIGNVEGMLYRASPVGGRVSEAITTRGGVVGYRLPPFKVTTLPLAPRDVLVLSTDGIRLGFSATLDLAGQPQAIADGIFAGFAKGSDDALVLVARYLGVSA